jgi:hypothetical protein
MALMLRTIGQVRTAFKRWADRFVKDNGLGDAVRAHDLEKVRRIANAKLSKVEAGVLVEYYFPDLVRERVKRELLWPSASNAGRKRRQRERNQDKIVGDRLNPKPARVTRSSTLQKLSQHIKFRNNLLENAEPDISEDFKVKEIVSLSSDVIFNPATQTTRYSAQREAKRNLERRMQGYEIDVLYGSGEGLLRFFAKGNLVLNHDGHDHHVTVNAEAVASPSDMALHSVELIIDGKVLSIEPADKALMPEEAVTVLRRIAENCIRNGA